MVEHAGFQYGSGLEGGENTTRSSFDAAGEPDLRPPPSFWSLAELVQSQIPPVPTGRVGSMHL